MTLSFVSRISVGLLLCALSVHAQVSTTVNRTFETSFQSSRSYSAPQKDVRLVCAFRSPDGVEYRVHGFWNGDSTYTVRFNPPRTGVWTYVTSCNDTLNPGLHRRTGSMQVLPYSGDNALYAHGWLRVSDDSLYFVHDDGTPFFYLADTMWEIMWKGTMPDIRTVVSDRRAKKFSALQVCAISHQMIGQHGMRNQNWENSFLDFDPCKPNPAYYRFVDSVVTLANDSGMVVVMSPLWAYFSVLHGDPNQARLLTIEESLEHARYIAARYAGHHVLWIVAGDGNYSDSARHAFWPRFARMLQEAGGRRHLTSMHTQGACGSFTYYENTEDWLDFHMFQSGHAISWNTWHLPEVGRSKRPTKPVLDAEPCYEDINSNFWEADTTLWFRMTDDMIRRARYEGIIEGAIVGTAYGGNGIWQWHVPSITEVTHVPRQYVTEAIHMPGSAQMTVLRSLCERFRWYTWTRRPDLMVDRPSSERLCFAMMDDTIIAYAPKEGAAVEIGLERPARFYRIERWDPRTGLLSHVDTVIHSPSRPSILISALPGQEAFMVVKPLALLNLPSLPVNFSIAPIFSGQRPVLRAQSGEEGQLDVEWFDMMGRQVFSTSLTLYPGTMLIGNPALGAGIYWYRARLREYSGREESATGRIVLPPTAR